jgi:hypothetical protein
VGEIPGGLSELEVRQFFTPSPDELQAVRLRRRPLNRLGVGLQIGHLRLTGTPMNSVQMIPPEVLAFISDQVGIPAPRLASIRALYRRRRTLFEHQTAAMEALGLRDLSEQAERSLNGFLRREAGERHAVADLVTAARGWLADHQYLQLPLRRLKTPKQHIDKMLAVLNGIAAQRTKGVLPSIAGIPEAVEDGQAAVRLVRSRAGD